MFFCLIFVSWLDVFFSDCLKCKNCLFTVLNVWSSLSIVMCFYFQHSAYIIHDLLMSRWLHWDLLQVICDPAKELTGKWCLLQMLHPFVQDTGCKMCFVHWLFNGWENVVVGGAWKSKHSKEGSKSFIMLILKRVVSVSVRVYRYILFLVFNLDHHYHVFSSYSCYRGRSWYYWGCVPPGDAERGTLDVGKIQTGGSVCHTT